MTGTHWRTVSEL